MRNVFFFVIFLTFCVAAQVAKLDSNLPKTSIKSFSDVITAKAVADSGVINV